MSASSPECCAWGQIVSAVAGSTQVSTVKQAWIWQYQCADGCSRQISSELYGQTVGVHHAETAPESWCAPHSDCPRELVCTMLRLPQTAGVHHAKTAPDRWCAPRQDCPRQLVCTTPRLPQRAGVHHAQTAPESWCAPHRDCPRQLAVYCQHWPVMTLSHWAVTSAAVSVDIV